MLIYKNSQEPSLFEGEIEADEPYFGNTRKGKPGRDANNKIPVFCLLKRSSKVYDFIILNVKVDTLLPITREKVKPDSIVYTDSFRSYNILDVSEFTLYRINYSENFVHNKNYISGIKGYGVKLSITYIGLTGC